MFTESKALNSDLNRLIPGGAHTYAKCDDQYPEGMAPVIESFNEGWKVEISAEMPAAEYLVGLDEIGGLRDAAARLAGGDSPARVASAIEFILEGLHLANRLNKDVSAGSVRYGPGAR